MRYYEVTAKCGHVGKGFYIPITFPVRAKTAAEAASVTRAFPRVKHDHKDAILSVREVDPDDYDNQWTVNNYDPYLMCRNRQDQLREYDAIYNRLVKEKRSDWQSVLLGITQKIVTGRAGIPLQSYQQFESGK